ncbi:MAG: hypothetical protein K6F09_02150, partial [Clostridiales bacterium]|nr:hypothetical protein [Clostridiales bacterium]
LRQLETEYLDRLGDENDADAIADFTYWAYQQYLALIKKDDQGKNVLDYAKEYVDDLFDLLEDPVIADLLDLVANASGSSDDISKTIDQLKSYKKSINDAYNFFYDRVLTSSKYNTVMNGLAARSEAELKSYVKDLQDFAQNATKYVDIVIDEETNDWLRLMSGNQSYIYDASRRVVVDITVSTGGQVAYATSEGDAGVTYTTAKTGYKAGGSATLTAAPKAGFNSEFLYWVNNETNRIVSTARTLVLNTSIDTDIEAVFNILPDQTYAFTNPTGWIQESYSQDGDETVVMLPEAAPAMPGLTFTKWAAAKEGDASIDVATLAANATDVANKGAVLTSAVADQENGRVLSIGANYINTAAYVDAAGEMHRFNVEFIDNGVSTVLRQPIYSSAIYTAKGDGFKYWIDAETEEIVCLSARFQYKTIGDATFEAIYTSDAEVPAAVIRIAKKTVENGDITFFVERSVAPGYSVVRSGAILTRDLDFAATDDFVLGAPRIGVGTAVDKGNTGVYAVTTSLDNGSTIGCRGYLEYKNDATGETFLIYTDAATYGGLSEEILD